MSDSLKSKTVRGLKWTSMDSVSQNIFQIILGLTLAKLVSVEDFGIIAVLMIFIYLANLFQDSGFGVALTRKKEVTREEYSSVFYFSITLSLVIYTTLFFSIGLISRFQGQVVPVALARVLFLSFVVTSLSTVPYVILSRDVDYKSIAYSNFIGQIISCTTGVVLAWLGYGAWAICIQTVLYQAIRTLGLWICCKWKPMLSFSFRPLKEMFSFSSKLMLTYILYTFANNFTSNLIDRYFSRTEAGYYSQASRWYNKPIQFFTLPISNVSLPVISKVNDELERQRRIFRKMIKTMSFVAFPLTIIFAYIVPDFVLIFLGEKWVPAIPYMQLLSLSAIFVPFDTLLFSLMNSKGRSGPLFIFSLVKSILLIAVIFISIKYGVITLIVTSGIVNYLFFIAISLFCIHLVSCRKRDYLKDILPYLFIPLVLVLIAYPIFSSIQNIYLSFILKGSVPALSYLIIMYLGKSEIIIEGIGYVQRFIDRKRGNK